MQQIVHFIVKYRSFLLFLLLEIIAISLTIQNHSFHKSKFINSANFITGGIYKRIHSFQEYADLKQFNEQLLNENNQLKNLLSQRLKDSDLNPVFVIDTLKYYQKYSYIAATIIHNQYDKKYNFLTIDKGTDQGVHPDQGVMNSKGIIGIVNSVSKNYATVLSILNENSKINVKLLNSFHFGTLAWDGKDYNTLQLLDLPVQAPLKEGDTIVTGGKSTIFPEGIPVGTISDFNKENNAYTEVNIRLFNDMSALGPVYIVNNFDRDEIIRLQESMDNE